MNYWELFFISESTFFSKIIFFWFQLPSKWENCELKNIKKDGWRRRASIPLPPVCETGALPFELLPRYNGLFS